MAGLEPHKFTVRGKDYFVRLPDVYDNGADYTIGSALKISKLADNATIPDNADTIEVGDGIKNGQLIRLRLSYKDVTDNNKSKSASIICPIDQASTAKAGLMARKYKGSKVTSAAVPRRRRLG